VKRIAADEKSIRLELTPREHQAFVHALQLYPCVPPAHHQLTHADVPEDLLETQRLPDEALAQERAANQRRVAEWLGSPGRFAPSEKAVQFTVERADAEWLLQVLNDVRVGHWLRLGSPEPQQLVPDEMQPDQLSLWFTMEMSGYFQMGLLEFLD
jgi:hypothetical protein